MQTPNLLTIKLPIKISANKIYAGAHFATRNKLKKDFYLIVNSQTKYKVPYEKFEIEFNFFWQKNVPDADNNYLIAKMILDIITDGNDGWQRCKGVTYRSNRSVLEFDYVEISVVQYA